MQNGSNSIKRVMLQAKTLPNGSDEIEKVYIEYNDNHIDIIEKTSSKTQAEFMQDTKKFLLSIGATSENKGSKWFVCHRENGYDFDFDEMDRKYEQQKQNVNTSNNPSLPAVIDNKKKDIIKNENENNVQSFEKTQSIIDKELEEIKKKEELKAKKANRYKIKKISSIFSAEKDNINKAAMSALLTGAIGFVTVASATLFINSTPIPTLIGIGLTIRQLKKTGENIEEIKFSNMMSSLFEALSERIKYTAKDAIDGIFNKAKEQGLNNIENGKSR